MTFPFWNLLEYQLQVFRIQICIALHCAWAPSLFVAFTSNRTLEIALWKRKYPILFQQCQGQSSIIPAVNSLLTSKGCIYRCFKTQKQWRIQTLS